MLDNAALQFQLPTVGKKQCISLKPTVHWLVELNIYSITWAETNGEPTGWQRSMLEKYFSEPHTTLVFEVGHLVPKV
jgi:hypothetical protein